MTLRLASRLCVAIALVLIVAGCEAPEGITVGAAVDPPAAGLTGTWKLIVLALGEDEFAIINVQEKDGKPAASVVAIQNSAAR